MASNASHEALDSEETNNEEVILGPNESHNSRGSEESSQGGIMEPSSSTSSSHISESSPITSPEANPEEAEGSLPPQTTSKAVNGRKFTAHEFSSLSKQRRFAHYDHVVMRRHGFHMEDESSQGVFEEIFRILPGLRKEVEEEWFKQYHPRMHNGEQKKGGKKDQVFGLCKSKHHGVINPNKTTIRCAGQKLTGSDLTQWKVTTILDSGVDAIRNMPARDRAELYSLSRTKSKPAKRVEIFNKSISLPTASVSNSGPTSAASAANAGPDVRSTSRSKGKQRETIDLTHNIEEADVLGSQNGGSLRASSSMGAEMESGGLMGPNRHTTLSSLIRTGAGPLGRSDDFPVRFPRTPFENGPRPSYLRNKTPSSGSPNPRRPLQQSKMDTDDSPYEWPWDLDDDISVPAGRSIHQNISQPSRRELRNGGIDPDVELIEELFDSFAYEQDVFGNDPTKSQTKPPSTSQPNQDSPSSSQTMASQPIGRRAQPSVHQSNSRIGSFGKDSLTRSPASISMFQRPQDGDAQMNTQKFSHEQEDKSLEDAAIPTTASNMSGASTTPMKRVSFSTGAQGVKQRSQTAQAQTFTTGSGSQNEMEPAKVLNSPGMMVLSAGSPQPRPKRKAEDGLTRRRAVGTPEPQHESTKRRATGIAGSNSPAPVSISVRRARLDHQEYPDPFGPPSDGPAAAYPNLKLSAKYKDFSKRMAVLPAGQITSQIPSQSMHQAMPHLPLHGLPQNYAQSYPKRPHPTPPDVSPYTIIGDDLIDPKTDQPPRMKELPELAARVDKYLAGHQAKAQGDPITRSWSEKQWKEMVITYREWYEAICDPDNISMGDREAVRRKIQSWPGAPAKLDDTVYETPCPEYQRITKQWLAYRDELVAWRWEQQNGGASVSRNYGTIPRPYTPTRMGRVQPAISTPGQQAGWNDGMHNVPNGLSSPARPLTMPSYATPPRPCGSSQATGGPYGTALGSVAMTRNGSAPQLHTPGPWAGDAWSHPRQFGSPRAPTMDNSYTTPADQTQPSHSSRPQYPTMDNPHNFPAGQTPTGQVPRNFNPQMHMYSPQRPGFNNPPQTYQVYAAVQDTNYPGGFHTHRMYPQEQMFEGQGNAPLQGVYYDPNGHPYNAPITDSNAPSYYNQGPQYNPPPTAQTFQQNNYPRLEDSVRDQTFSQPAVGENAYDPDLATAWESIHPDPSHHDSRQN